MGSNRYLEGENRGSIGLDASLFFTETFGFTGQLIRSHGPEEGGRWAFFVRPARDTATSHIHFRYTHLGDRFSDHVNAIGFIRDDDRREMDSAFRKQFWFTDGVFERVDYNSNYNIYWSQKGVLRSWQVDQSIDIDFRNRWSAGWAFAEEFKLFEKEFRNRRKTRCSSATTRVSFSPSPDRTRSAAISIRIAAFSAPPSEGKLPKASTSSTSSPGYGSTPIPRTRPPISTFFAPSRTSLRICSSRSSSKRTPPSAGKTCKLFSCGATNRPSARSSSPSSAALRRSASARSKATRSS